MSDAVQIALIAATLPAVLSIVSNIVTHLLANRTRQVATAELKKVDQKVDHITELSNSMLQKTKEEKDQAEKKLEQAKADQLMIANTKITELEKQLALLTKPADSKEGGH